MARSNVLEQLGKRRKEAAKAQSVSRQEECTEGLESAENALLLARIRELVGERPRWGRAGILRSRSWDVISIELAEAMLASG